MKNETGDARDDEREHGIDDAERETKGESRDETPPVRLYICIQPWYGPDPARRVCQKVSLFFLVFGSLMR